MGISPRRYTGWEPATTTRTHADGTTTTTREPEWDWIDRAIINAWLKLTRDACTLCGRPWAVHDTDDEADYNVGWLECTATRAIDKAQAEKHREDQRSKPQPAGHNPDRARQWTAWTDAEGPPSTT